MLKLKSNSGLCLAAVSSCLFNYGVKHKLGNNAVTVTANGACYALFVITTHGFKITHNATTFNHVIFNVS